MVLFSEDHIQETKRRGRIEVICGSMFSGKTEELIRRLKRAKFAKQRVEIYKPAIDTRYSEADVVSHDSNIISSTPIDSSASILLFTSEIDVVGIDEAQFFDEGLIDVCNQLANNGIRVIVAGLENKRDPEKNPRSLYPLRFALAPAGVPGLGASPGVGGSQFSSGHLPSMQYRPHASIISRSCASSSAESPCR